MQWLLRLLPKSSGQVPPQLAQLLQLLPDLLLKLLLDTLVQLLI